MTSKCRPSIHRYKQVFIELTVVNKQVLREYFLSFGLRGNSLSFLSRSKGRLYNSLHLVCGKNNTGTLRGRQKRNGTYVCSSTSQANFLLCRWLSQQAWNTWRRLFYAWESGKDYHRQEQESSLFMA